MLLAEKLYSEGMSYAEGWNFGPKDIDARPVAWIARTLCEVWGMGAAYEIQPISQPHEAHYLKLDCSKAKQRLGWQPRWDLATALVKIIDWVRAYERHEDLREVCLRQIREFTET